MPTQTTSVIHTIGQEFNFLPLDTLRHDGIHYMAGQTGNFEADEKAWAHDENGRWRGPHPIPTTPQNLRIENATDETHGIDVVQRVTDGTSVVVRWDIPHYVNISLVDLLDYADVDLDSVKWEYFLQSLDNGSVIESGSIDGLEKYGSGPLDYKLKESTFTFSNIPNGSYLVGVRLETFMPPFALPDDYTRDFRYQWGASPTDYWDYVYNVGKLPPEGHLFHELRAEILANNEQRDKSEWTFYLIGNESEGGEWSARFLQVGNGAFTDSNIIPASGASLYTITGQETRTAVLVDSMARTGNVLYTGRDGSLLLAGQRMSHTGIVTALWEYDGVSWELLGTHRNSSTGVCECALENHGATDILETDTDLYILTKCALFRYEPDKPITERLQGFPKDESAPYTSPSGETVESGFPGGASLREFQKTLYFTTESFGKRESFELNGQERMRFYDELVITKGTQRLRGMGTRFHGNNDMANWLGKLWAVVQDKNDADDATQYITHFGVSDWEIPGKLKFDPLKVQWQRLIGTPGAGANVLVAFGKRVNSEQGIIGIGDGVNFISSDWDYRIRRATLSPNGDDTKKVLLAIGRESEPGEIDTSAWHIVELDIEGGSDGDKPVITEPDQNCEGGIGCTVVTLKITSDEPIYAIECTSVEPERIIEKFNQEHAGIWARVDSDVAPNDESSYTIPIPYGRRAILPTPAQSHVDVMFYIPYGCDPLEANPKVLVRF